MILKDAVDNAGLGIHIWNLAETTVNTFQKVSFSLRIVMEF
jgi:hypothetical protein